MESNRNSNRDTSEEKITLEKKLPATQYVLISAQLLNAIKLFANIIGQSYVLDSVSFFIEERKATVKRKEVNHFRRRLCNSERSKAYCKQKLQELDLQFKNRMREYSACLMEREQERNQDGSLEETQKKWQKYEENAIRLFYEHFQFVVSRNKQNIALNQLKNQIRKIQASLEDTQNSYENMADPWTSWSTGNLDSDSSEEAQNPAQISALVNAHFMAPYLPSPFEVVGEENKTECHKITLKKVTEFERYTKNFLLNNKDTELPSPEAVFGDEMPKVEKDQGPVPIEINQNPSCYLNSKFTLLGNTLKISNKKPKNEAFSIETIPPLTRRRSF